MAQRTIAEYLDKSFLSNQTGFAKIVNRNFCKITSCGQCFKSIEIDSFILNSVDILEAEFRNATLQRHLTSLKSYLAAVA